jgi:hypothetical protein
MVENRFLNSEANVMKKEVLLQFPSFDKIKGFMSEIRLISFGIIPSQNILRCNCSDDQVNLAIGKYEARVASGNQP